MNKIEQKEIEEMARKIDYAINNECKLNNGQTCGDCLFDNKGDWNCQSKMMASFLHGEGYRQVKDKVVLSKEEFDKLGLVVETVQEENGQLRLENNDLEAENNKLKEELAKASELKAETIKLAKQETAEKIFKKLEYYYHFMSDTIMIPKELFNELAKQYGVEME